MIWIHLPSDFDGTVSPEFACLNRHAHAFGDLQQLLTESAAYILGEDDTMA